MAKQNKSKNIMIGKSNLHVALAQSFKREIESGYSRYYYYLSAMDGNMGTVPVDSVSYEMAQRRNMFIAKHIMPFEVSLVTRRYDWIKGEVYAEYDDISGGSLLGIDVKDAGAGFDQAPVVYVGSNGAKKYVGGSHYNYADMVKVTNEYGTFHFIVLTNNPESSTSNDPEVNLLGYNPEMVKYGCGSIYRDGDINFLPVKVDDANGDGAVAVAILNERFKNIGEIRVINGGKGYTGKPSITVVPPYQNLNDESFRNVDVEAIVKGSNLNLRDEKFYVVTEELNVYKCINNNEGSPSTIQPYGNSYQILKLADGYEWLYLYTIDAQAKSRFMNADYIPIVDYDPESVDGSVIITIQNGGRGYEWALLEVEGDGYLKENPYYLEMSDSDFTVNKQSTDYSEENIKNIKITFEPPHSGTTLWGWYENEEDNVFDTIGMIVQYGNNFYKVLSVGNYNDTPPRHTSGRVMHGEVNFEYYGSVVNAVYDTNPNVQKVIVEKNIKGVDIVYRGEGNIPRTSVIYKSPDKKLSFTQLKSGVVVFNANDFMTEYDVVDVVTKDGKPYGNCKLLKESYYSFFVIDSNGDVVKNIDSITINQNVEIEFYFVNGYCTTAVILNQGSHLSGSEFGGFVFDDYKPGNTYALNAIVNYKGNDYICVTSGTTKEGEDINLNPDVKTGAIFKLLGKSVTFKYHFKAGGFYRFRPKVTFEYLKDDGFYQESEDIIEVDSYFVTKSEMIVVPIIDANGEIIDTRIVKEGIGYTYANIEVQSDSPNISPARITASVFNSLIESSLSDRRLITVGEIFNIKMITKGSNYNWKKPPIITIEGDGEGCTAIVRETDINPRSGAIERITITNYGRGYTWARVKIENVDEYENGVGAMARAIISPIGGHGSNPTYELFADSVMLYSDLNNLEYDVFQLISAYRSSGLLKNPRDITKVKTSANLVTTSWKIVVRQNDLGGLLKVGDVLTDEEGHTYKVLNVYHDNYRKETHLLVSDNDNTEFKVVSRLIFNDRPYDLLSFNQPTLNPMTGELLTIDNTTIEAYSEIENAILRTLIEF